MADERLRSWRLVAADRSRTFLLGAFVVGLAVSITLAETALAVLVVRLVVRIAAGRAHLRGWPLAVPFLLWAAVSLISLVGSHARVFAVKDLLLITTFYVLVDALSDSRAADAWMTALLGVTAVAAVVGILQVAFCPRLMASPWLGGLPHQISRVFTKCHRAHAFFSIYMTLAGVLSLVLLSTLPRLLPQSGATSFWRRAAWVATAIGLGATYVRGAWVGFAAGVVTLLGLVRHGRTIVAVGVVALALALFLVPTVRRRAESTVDPTDPTARERLAMWASALRMARDHPLIGVGPGHVKREYPRYAAPEFAGKSRGHVHDTPLQVLVERGVLGFLAWIGIYGAFFWRAGSVLRALPPTAVRERALVAGSIAAIAGFLVGGLTEYNFGDSEVVLVAYSIMAIPFVTAGGAPSDDSRPSFRQGGLEVPAREC